MSSRDFKFYFWVQVDCESDRKKERRALVLFQNLTVALYGSVSVAQLFRVKGATL